MGLVIFLLCLSFEFSSTHHTPSDAGHGGVDEDEARDAQLAQHGKQQVAHRASHTALWVRVRVRVRAKVRVRVRAKVRVRVGVAIPASLASR